jgi:hypothetical protein
MSDLPIDWPNHRESDIYAQIASAFRATRILAGTDVARLRQHRLDAIAVIEALSLFDPTLDKLSLFSKTEAT